MKILAVSPVPAYATRDVWTGQVQGLKANGVEALPLDYSKVWDMFTDFKEFMEVTGRAEYGSTNAALLAGDRIVMAAIINEVDLVHFVAPMHVAPVAIQVLKQYAGIKTSAYFTECPYDDEHTMKMAEIFDYCFVCDETSVAPFRARNPNTYYVGHAYNPEVHVKNGKEECDTDVRFIGTNFPSRVTFLEQVDWEGIDLRLHGIMRLGRSPLAQFVKDGPVAVPNKDAIKLYRKARINLQLHRKDGFDPRKAKQGKRSRKGGLIGATPIDNFTAHSLGPRSYELAAIGAFQVSDVGREELDEVFDGCVPTYETPDDLSVLLRRYLDDPVLREEAAEKQYQAVQPYTFESRMRVLLDAVN